MWGESAAGTAALPVSEMLKKTVSRPNIIRGVESKTARKNERSCGGLPCKPWVPPLSTRICRGFPFRGLMIQ